MESMLSKQIMREVLTDSFNDKKTGRPVQYTQLQLEHVEATGRVVITRVSVPAERTEEVVKLAAKLKGQPCDVTVEVSAGDNKQLKYRLIGLPHLSAKVQAA